jgi:hypothetical protein
MNEEDKFIIIKKSTKEDWYHELEHKMVKFDAEDENFFYINVRGEPNRISKLDAVKAEPVELDLPEDVIEEIDRMAQQMGLTRDEFMNVCLENFIRERSNGKD